MARVGIRDLPDHIYEAICESPEKNNRSIEGEVRAILQTYVSTLEPEPAPNQTLRQIWQKGVGDRLDLLFAHLRKDQVFFPGHAPTLAGIARLIGEETPAHLLDCLDGIASPSFDMLDRVIAWSSGSQDWLESGVGPMFPAKNIGSEYSEFFLYERDSKEVTFHLLRVCGGRLDGMILCVRHDRAKQAYATGFIYEHFNLKRGMGAGGHGNLHRFIRFLKTNCGDRILKAYRYEEPEKSTEPGAHHPQYYLRLASEADWLQKLFAGEDPADWLEGNRSAWKEIAELSFGNGKVD